jgi:integrase
MEGAAEDRDGRRRPAHRGHIMLQLGVPARVVMEILGHSTIKLTMDTYSHVMPELLADAADQLDTLFG